MKRTLLAILLAVLTAIGFATFAVGNAEAWKCEVHPEKVNCTTTTGPVNTTIVQSTTSTPTTVPEVTTTVPVTTTTGPPPPPEVTTTPSTVPPAPPTPPKFAG